MQEYQVINLDGYDVSLSNIREKLGAFCDIEIGYDGDYRLVHSIKIHGMDAKEFSSLYELLAYASKILGIYYMLEKGLIRQKE